MRNIWSIILVLLMLILSGSVSAFGVWESTTDSYDSLEEAIQSLEKDVHRAIDGKSAHPAFLDALEDHIAALYAILADLRGVDTIDVGWGDWEPTDTRAGSRIAYSSEGVDFFMRLAPAATFPIGIDNSEEATVKNNYWIAETLVTYELWYVVRVWAEENGYIFENKGREGSHGATGEEPDFWRNEPVTMVNWYDSVVWCNALSELLGYDAVYRYQGRIYRDATDTGVGNQVVQELTLNGFRLPTSNEWELAARYKGSDSSHGAIEHPEGSGQYWTPGNYASGARADIDNEEVTREVAWYTANANKTQNVGGKLPNQLGLFDISGNVCGWHFTLSGSNRVRRGGSWKHDNHFLQVGVVGGNLPGRVFDYNGLRFVRTHF